MGEKIQQLSFTGGELSPSLYARVDLARFQTSLRQAKNFIVRPWGGVSNRPGFQYVGNLYSHAVRGRLIPFVYSTEIAYVIELGNQVMRFYVDGALVERSVAITGVTQANPAVVTAAGHGFINGQTVTISGVVGMTQLNGNTYTVAGATATTFQLQAVNSTGFGAYVSGGTAVGAVAVATPWAEADLPLVRHTQSADVMTLCCRGHAPRQLTRTSSTSFTLAEFVSREGPFRDLNADQAIYMWASAATGPVTVHSNVAVFTADMVGSLVYLEQKELARIPPWTQGERGIAVGTLRRSDGKTYKCVTLPTAPAGNDWQETGSWRPTHEYGRAWDGGGDARDNGTQQWTVGIEWEYQDSGYGIVKITGFTSSTQVSGEVVRQLPTAVVGGVGAVVVGSPWTFSGDGVTTSFSIAGATSDSEADYTVTINGAYVQPNPHFFQPPGAGPGGGGLETP